MARLRVKVDLPAAEELRRIARWWRVNRPANPGLLKRELADARALLAERPDAGARVGGIPADVRRLLLPRTQYYLYYRVDRGARCVIVIAIWHTARGSRPLL